MLPVRCFTCNKVLANKGTTFEKMKIEEKPMEEIWQVLGLTRPCCRMIMISHVDLTDKMMEYTEYNPCKYIEIRNHPPKEEDDDLSTKMGAMKVDDSSSAAVQTISVTKKGVRVYRAV